MQPRYGRIIAQCGWVRGRDFDRMIAAHAISTQSYWSRTVPGIFVTFPGLRSRTGSRVEIRGEITPLGVIRRRKSSRPFQSCKPFQRAGRSNQAISIEAALGPFVRHSKETWIASTLRASQ